MKCPKCNQEPISLKKYLTKVNNFTMKCQHCETELKTGVFLFIIGTILTVSSIAVGIKIGLSIGRWSPGDTIFVYILIGLLVLAGLADVFTWKYGKYVIKNE